MRSKGATLNLTSAKLRPKHASQVTFCPDVGFRGNTHTSLRTNYMLASVGNFQYDYYDYYSDDDYSTAFSSYGGCFYRSFNWWLGHQQVPGIPHLFFGSNLYNTHRWTKSCRRKSKTSLVGTMTKKRVFRPLTLSPQG